jgi:hypothetical protein
VGLKFSQFPGFLCCHNQPIKIIGLGMAGPSIQQLEKHIRKCVLDDSNVVFVNHAHQQMRKRLINRPMVMEVLRMGRIHLPPEPDIRFSGLKCRMERFVSGMNVAVVVAVEYPEPSLIVVTVIDITKE